MGLDDGLWDKAAGRQPARERQVAPEPAILGAKNRLRALNVIADTPESPVVEGESG